MGEVVGFSRAISIGLALIFCAIPSTACSQAAHDTFPDRNVSKFVECVSKQAVELCKLDEAKLNVRSEDGWTPLLWLLAKRQILADKMIALIKAGADPHQPSSPTAVGFAIEEMPIEYLKALVTAGLDVNSLPRAGEDRGWHDAFIFSAILGGDIEKVRYLLDHGANLEIRDSMDRTPILAATAQFETQKLLLERGADPTVVDATGRGVCHPVETMGLSRTHAMRTFLEMLKSHGVVCILPSTLETSAG